jgi:hypothetical protein
MSGEGIDAFTAQQPTLLFLLDSACTTNCSNLLNHNCHRFVNPPNCLPHLANNSAQEAHRRDIISYNS